MGMATKGSTPRVDPKGGSAGGSNGLSHEIIEIKDLVPDPTNPRRHDIRNRQAIRSSLETHGQVAPIVVQVGTNIIIAGNATTEAMKDIGYTHASVVMLDCDDKERKQLAVRLNRSAELAGWDSATLGEFLSDVKEEEGGAWDPEAYGFNASEWTNWENAWKSGGPIVKMPDTMPPSDPVDLYDSIVAEFRIPPSAVESVLPKIQELANELASMGVTLDVC